MERHSPARGQLGDHDNPAVSLLLGTPQFEESAAVHIGDGAQGMHATDGYEDCPPGACEEDGYTPGEYAAGDYAAGDYTGVEYAAADYGNGEYPLTHGGAAEGANLPQGQPYEDGLLGGRQKQPGRTQRNRRKGDKKPFLKRSWLCIFPDGTTSVLQADKYKLTAQLGIQTRDLRLLDPNMATTYPSAILCRDKSIVVNLEHIKVIITTDRVLVVNHEDEGNAKFVEELKQRIAHPGGTVSKSFPSTHDLQRLGGAGGTGGGKGGTAPVKSLPNMAAVTLGVELPFELRVLEICLDELASEYDLQATELEAAAYPALDTLAAKVTSPHLERVRRLKNRLVRLTTRVETVREVLEKFLDDDEDMHDLNLTANKEREAVESEGEMADVHMVEGAGEGPGGVLGPGSRLGSGEPKSGYMGRRVSLRSSVSSASTDSSIVENEVAEVEMLLEAYFMHFDNTYNRLATLNEYIKDTEDLVNIKLDQHRNQLITTDLILTAFTAAMAIVTTIAGIFGMNLDSGLQDAPGVFNQVTIISCVGSFLLFVAFVVWAWWFGLLVFD